MIGMRIEPIGKGGRTTPPNENLENNPMQSSRVIDALSDHPEIF
jgi:hypothetical protein